MFCLRKCLLFLLRTCSRINYANHGQVNSREVQYIIIFVGFLFEIGTTIKKSSGFFLNTGLTGRPTNNLNLIQTFSILFLISQKIKKNESINRV